MSSLIDMTGKNMQFDERIKIIAEHYGEEQLVQLVEECNELSVACLHFKRGEEKGSINKRMNNLISEICDVEIVISQLKYLLNITDADIHKIKEYKVNRQIERINNGLE